MGARRAGLVLALALGGCARPAPPPAPATPLAGRWVLRGDTVAVAILAGELRVAPAAGPDVVVEAHVRGPDAGLLRAELERRAGGDVLRVRLAGRRLVYPGLATHQDSVEVRLDGDAYAPAGGLPDRLAGALLGRRDAIRIVRRGPGPRAAADLTVRLPRGRRVRLNAAAGTVVISGASGTIEVSSLFAPVHAEGVSGGLRIRTHDAPVRVHGGAAALAVRTRAGAVEVEEARGPRIALHATGGSIWAAGVESPRVGLRTQAGSITVQRVRTDSLWLDTGAGSIVGGQIAAGALSAETEAGRIVLEVVRAPAIALDTGKGSVRLVLAGDITRLDIDAGGAVTVGVPRTLDATLRVEAGDGGVGVEIAADTIRAARRHYEGRAGAGRGRIRIDAGGAVRITNDPGPPRRTW